MNKKKLVIFLIGFTFLLISWQFVKASQQNSIETDYSNLGYTTVAKAVQETESYFKTTLDLPNKLPPLDFTHSFGRFNRDNESLEIEYLNEEKRFNYIINVIPAARGKNLRTSTDEQIELKDGSTAYYYTVSGPGGKKGISLMFEKGDWTYLLSIDESAIEKPLSTLVEIANSL